jgi:NaMN:DMB phosphoribosyltransferase
MNLFEKTLQQIHPIDPSWMDAAARRQLELTKPPGSLGRLEEIANRCAAIRESFELTANHPRIVLFAADHGVCTEGVSPYPQEVTAQMVLNFLRGGAAINALARAGNIELKIVDMGVAIALPPSSQLISRRAAPGTKPASKSLTNPSWPDATFSASGKWGSATQPRQAPSPLLSPVNPSRPSQVAARGPATNVWRGNILPLAALSLFTAISSKLRWEFSAVSAASK